MERRGFIFFVDPGILFDEEIPDPHQAMKAPILVQGDVRIRARTIESGEES
jgi:hypothetical protein